MKRTLLPILVLIALSTVSFAQNAVTDSTATVVGYWKKGDKIKLSYTYSKEKFEGNKSVSKGTSNSIVELTVLEENEKSYVLQWKYSNINVTDTEKIPSCRASLKLLKASPINTGQTKQALLSNY